MAFGVMQHLDIVVCEDGVDAANKGFIYHSGYKALEISKAVVVRNGTAAGNSTVDLNFVDKDGNKYVCMITAALLSSLLGACK